MRFEKKTKNEVRLEVSVAVRRAGEGQARAEQREHVGCHLRELAPSQTDLPLATSAELPQSTATRGGMKIPSDIMAPSTARAF